MIKHVKFKPLIKIKSVIEQFKHKKSKNPKNATDGNKVKTKNKHGEFQFFKKIKNTIKQYKHKKNNGLENISKNIKEQENLQMNYSTHNITNESLKEPLEIDLDDILKDLEVKDEFIEETEIEQLSNMVNNIIQYDTENTITNIKTLKKLVNTRKYEKDDLDDLLEELTVQKTPKLNKHMQKILQMEPKIRIK